MNQSEIILTLVSNVASTTSHQNTVAHFVTKLSKPLELRGSYECALCELIVPGLDENKLNQSAERSTRASFMLGNTLIINVKSDVIQPTLYSSTQKRVLRSVVIDLHPLETGYTHLIFETLQFRPVSKEVIREIAIKFELPTGDIVPFLPKRSQVVLCIKKTP